MQPASPVPRLDNSKPVTMGDLVIYTGDVLDHDKEVSNRLSSLIGAIKSVSE